MGLLPALYYLHKIVWKTVLKEIFMLANKTELVCCEWKFE